MSPNKLENIDIKSVDLNKISQNKLSLSYCQSVELEPITSLGSMLEAFFFYDTKIITIEDDYLEFTETDEDAHSFLSDYAYGIAHDMDLSSLLVKKSDEAEGNRPYIECKSYTYTSTKIDDNKYVVSVRAVYRLENYQYLFKNVNTRKFVAFTTEKKTLPYYNMKGDFYLLNPIIDHHKMIQYFTYQILSLVFNKKSEGMIEYPNGVVDYAENMQYYDRKDVFDIPTYVTDLDRTIKHFKFNREFHDYENFYVF